ncbi:MAG: hypothetical protein Ct9H90mP9_3720 [Pseudomonadota bacterium]|nr:MAG: hypothetical protein Ct9H90mP9_3720 [Pseudomonadota bacterium]
MIFPPPRLCSLFDLNREVNSMLPPKTQPRSNGDAESLFPFWGGEVLGIIPEKIESGEPDQRLNE